MSLVSARFCNPFSFCGQCSLSASQVKCVTSMSKREQELQEEENRKAAEAARRAQQAQEREQRLADRQQRQQQPQQSGLGLGGLAAKVLQRSPAAKGLALAKRVAPSPPVPPPAYDPEESPGEAVAAVGGLEKQATRPTGVQEDQKGAGAPEADAKLQKSKTKEVEAQQSGIDLPKPAEAAASAPPPDPLSSLNNPFSYLRPSRFGGASAGTAGFGQPPTFGGPAFGGAALQPSQSVFGQTAQLAKPPVFGAQYTEHSFQSTNRPGFDTLVTGEEEKRPLSAEQHSQVPSLPVGEASKSNEQRGAAVLSAESEGTSPKVENRERAPGAASLFTGGGNKSPGQSREPLVDQSEKNGSASGGAEKAPAAEAKADDQIPSGGDSKTKPILNFGGGKLKAQSGGKTAALLGGILKTTPFKNSNKAVTFSFAEQERTQGGKPRVMAMSQGNLPWAARLEAALPRAGVGRWLAAHRGPALAAIEELREAFRKLGPKIEKVDIRQQSKEWDVGDETRVAFAQETAANLPQEEPRDQLGALDAQLASLYAADPLEESGITQTLAEAQKLMRDWRRLAQAHERVAELGDKTLKKTGLETEAADTHLLISTGLINVFLTELDKRLVAPMGSILDKMAEERKQQPVLDLIRVKSDPDGTWDLGGHRRARSSSEPRKLQQIIAHGFEEADAARQLFGTMTLNSRTAGSTTAGGSQGGLSSVGSGSGGGAAPAPTPPPGGSGGTAGGGASAGGGGGGGGGPFCSICYSSSHEAKDCPDRPRDGLGPTCPKCGKRGHLAWKCPLGSGGPICPHCYTRGHFEDDCRLKQTLDRRQQMYQPPSAEEIMYRAKAGLIDEPAFSSDEDEKLVKEDPRKVLKRQLRERRAAETSRQVERVVHEERRQHFRRWADIPRVRADLMYMITDDPKATMNDLDDEQKKELTRGMLSVYAQQLGRAQNSNEPGLGSSLKELGCDSVKMFSGEEGKYAVKPFLREVEDIKGFKRWTDPVAAAALGKLLTGTAKDWYENRKSDQGGVPFEYSALKHALLKEYYQKITLVEKTQIMASLKFDVAKHGSHLAFLTECEKKSFIIADRGYVLDDSNEMISRRQAREEMLLMFFIAGSAPAIRYEIDYSGAETKGEIKEQIRKLEDALRAKSNNPKALEPGYHVSEISAEGMEERMKDLGYAPAEINAVVKGRFSNRRNGDKKKVNSATEGAQQCWYCALEGHRRAACPSLKEDTRKGTVQPDRCGPREGVTPQVDAVKQRGKGTAGRGTAKGSGRGRAPARGRGRGRRVNEVDVDDDNGVEADESDNGASAGALGWQPTTASPPWNPWGAGYPMVVPYPMAPGAAQQKPAETAQISEVSEVRRTGPGALPTAYDLI